MKNKDEWDGPDILITVAILLTMMIGICAVFKYIP